MSEIEKLISQSDYVVINIMNYCRNLIPIAKNTIKRYGAIYTIMMEKITTMMIL
jgi:hypothetical protein